MISIVLPFRDAAATLDEALASVLQGDDLPREVIAVDDGSCDEGASIVRARARCDRRLRLVASEGRGIVAALRTGVAHARHRFIGRRDADDVSAPGRFAAQHARLELDPRLAVVGTRVEGFPEEALLEGTRLYLAWLDALITPEDHARELFVESPLCHPSVLMRRDALDAVGGYREVDGPEDYDLWLRFDAAGFGLAKVERALFRWRHHAARMTVRDPRLSIEGFTRVKAPFLAARLRRLGRPFAIWGAGPTGRRLARALEPYGARPERFLDIDPRKVGGVARGANIEAIEPIERHRSTTIVVAVGARGARALIRERLAEAGLVEGVDWLCAS